jgi:hypothetical protein
MAIYTSIDRGFARRSQFQNYSNSSNSRVVGLKFRSSLRDSCVRPRVRRKLIWRPKKISEHFPRNIGQDIVPSINDPSGPAVKDYRNFWGHSFPRNNLQIFEISGQNCRRSFDSFPSKFENTSWVYPPRLWFRSPCSRLRVGLLPRPIIIILVSSHMRFFREVALRLPQNLHCSQNPLPLRHRGRARRFQALCGAWSNHRLYDLLLTKSLRKWRSIELILHRFSPSALWHSRLITGKSWYVL